MSLVSGNHIAAVLWSESACLGSQKQWNNQLKLKFIFPRMFLFLFYFCLVEKYSNDVKGTRFHEFVISWSHNLYIHPHRIWQCGIILICNKMHHSHIKLSECMEALFLYVLLKVSTHWVIHMSRCLGYKGDMNIKLW